VVFANARKTSLSSYQIQIQPLNDCDPLTSMVCEERVGWPATFRSRGRPLTGRPSPCRHCRGLQGLAVYPLCDGKGAYLAYSSNSGTSLVVGDFNHTPTGTYYPRVVLNDGDAPYTVSCDLGNETFPFDVVVEGTVGDDGRVRSGTDMGPAFELGDDLSDRFHTERHGGYTPRAFPQSREWHILGGAHPIGV